MTAARLLGSLRLVVGAGSWLAPRASLRAFGLADDGAVLALRAGASRSAGPLVGLGAAAFCALGVLALREGRPSGSGA